MALFTPATASGLADRTAAIVQALNATLVSARQGAPTVASPGGYFQRATTTNDYNVENNFITPGNNADLELSGVSILGSDPKFQTLIQAFDVHTQVFGVSFDTYLTSSGLQLSQYFADLYNQVKGVQLSSHNVFAETPIVLASTTKVGAGNWTYAQGTALGAGGTARYANSPTTTGEQYLIAALPSGVSTSNCTMSASGLNDAGSVVQDSFTFPNSVANAQVQISQTNKYRTVTNIAVVTDTGITNGSQVVLFNRKQRVVTF